MDREEFATLFVLGVIGGVAVVLIAVLVL